MIGRTLSHDRTTARIGAGGDVNQDEIRDVLALRWGRIDDGALVFSGGRE